MLEIKKALENARSLYNLMRLMGHYELVEKLEAEGYDWVQAEFGV